VTLRLVMTALIVLLLPGSAAGQGRTDVVSLANGDRLTGEVVALERGRLEFKTDDAGTLYLEWDKLASVVTKRLVEVVTADGRRLLGSLGPGPSRALAVVAAEGIVTLAMGEVTIVRTVGRSFWRQLDGSIDVGYNYTRSSGVAQFNLNSDTVFRQLASQARLTASATLTQTDGEDGRDDRGSLEASYLKYPWQEVFVTAAGRFETNESLGIALRSQIGAAVGPRLINSNRAQMSIGGGLAFNDERGVDVEPTQNIEALGTFRTSFYTYDRPKTELDIAFTYYPSLSDLGRQRLQLDADVRREVFKDLFVSFNLYNSYDNRPPSTDANTNDIGFVLSIGWSY
jgi:hypothetical protein